MDEKFSVRCMFCRKTVAAPEIKSRSMALAMRLCCETDKSDQHHVICTNWICGSCRRPEAVEARKKADSNQEREDMEERIISLREEAESLEEEAHSLMDEVDDLESKVHSMQKARN